MTIIVVGSAAANALLGDDRWRRPKDIDVFTDKDMNVDAFWSDKLYAYFEKGEERWATLDELYTIKLSHIFWEGKNDKWGVHAQDLMRLKKEGAKCIDRLYTLLYGVWEGKFGKKRVDFDMDKRMFFDDGVKRVYDHDSIHRTVAYSAGFPLYESFLMEGEEVKMDMQKVWGAPYETQLQLFREEIYVTALERRMIPSKFHASPNAAYAYALRKVITSFTKGKSARFLAEHLDRLWKSEVDYVQRHRDNEHLLVKYMKEEEM